VFEIKIAGVLLTGSFILINWWDNPGFFVCADFHFNIIRSSLYLTHPRHSFLKRDNETGFDKHQV